MVALSTIIELSPDDTQAFLELEEHARGILRQRIADADDNQSWGPFWLEYMTHVREAARELEIEGFENWRVRPPIDFDEFQRFEHDVLSITIRLKFRLARRLRGELLEPESSDRTKIEFRVNQLRGEVAESGLTPKQKAAIDKKLDELVAEFKEKRVNRARVLVTIAAVAALLNQAQSMVVKGPETVVALLDIVHLIVGKEDERQALLERYRTPLAIEDKSQAEPRSAGGKKEAENFSDDLDDEIPF